MRGKAICDWCGMNVLWNPDWISEEDNMRRHKQSFNPMLRCLHKKFLDKNLLDPKEVTTA